MGIISLNLDTEKRFPTDSAKLMSTDLVRRLSQMDPIPVQGVGSIPPMWLPVWCPLQRFRRPS